MVIGAMKGALDVAQNRVDPSERGMLGALRPTSGHERLVNAPDVLHGGEAAQGIGHHDGTRCCFSLSLVESPDDLAGLFRRRTACDDGAIRAPCGGDGGFSYGGGVDG